MEAAAAKSLVSPPPSLLSKTHLRNPLSSSVSMLHDQAAVAVTSMPTTAITRNFPASVLLQEQRDDFRLLHIAKEEKTSQATLDRRQMENGMPVSEDKINCEFDQYLKEFQRQLLYSPGLLYLFPSLHTKENPQPSLSLESVVIDTDEVVDVKKRNSSNAVQASDVLALAKKAVMASKEAAALAENTSFLSGNLDKSLLHGSGSEQLAIQIPTNEEATVRSTRRFERRFKKRRLPKKPNVIADEVYSSRTENINRKINYKGIDQNDPLRLFLWGPITKQLLTEKEESALLVKVQDLLRLEEVKQRLQLQFDREPTLVEWAQAVGMSCRVLQSRLYHGNMSREKMIYANFRLVVHVAKQHQRWGLSLQDLLQEGSMGLMKSLEKFKPQAGCRFSTYAYWWIRQSIKKAIFQNSRTIRLPENIYGLLAQIKNARRAAYIQGHLPTNEELAVRVGITVEKLELLLLRTRNPISIQQPVWKEQDATYQEITSDPKVEIPDLSVTKQLMRQHVHNLLGILNPKERHIIRFRYGMHDGERKSLSQIGAVFGLSKERVRQVEGNALNKLKKCLLSQGLEAYAHLLI